MSRYYSSSLLKLVSFQGNEKEPRLAVADVYVICYSIDETSYQYQVERVLTKLKKIGGGRKKFNVVAQPHLIICKIVKNGDLAQIPVIFIFDSPVLIVGNCAYDRTL